MRMRRQWWQRVQDSAERIIFSALLTPAFMVVDMGLWVWDKVTPTRTESQHD